MWKQVTLIVFLMATRAVTFAQCSEYEVGETYYGLNNYIEYRPGNMPLIIAAPHGGYLTPSEISDRNCSGCVYVNDAFTLELGNELFDAIQAVTEGCTPHLIINHLDRRKMDGNRNIGEAADGDPLAEQAWNDFHGFIQTSKACVTGTFGKGFFVDLHGHGHTIQRIEYGYLLYEDELALSDATLNTSTYINWSSLRNLANTNVMGLTHAQLLRGDHALGTLLGNEGYPGVPSQQDPFPLINHPYFSGGYNTVVHSSYQGGSIDGVQIECNQSIRFNEAARQAFAITLAENLSTFIELHYAPRGGLCNTTVGIKEPEQTSIQMYPNPGRNRFNLSSNHSNSNIIEVEIFTLDGCRLHHQSTFGNENSFEVQGAGVYIVCVKTSDGKTARFRWINNGL